MTVLNVEEMDVLSIVESRPKGIKHTPLVFWIFGRRVARHKKWEDLKLIRDDIRSTIKGLTSKGYLKKRGGRYFTTRKNERDPVLIPVYFGEGKI
jgi:hypothetical protein